jgi:hypothetical protein
MNTSLRNEIAQIQQHYTNYKQQSEHKIASLEQAGNESVKHFEALNSELLKKHQEASNQLNARYNALNHEYAAALQNIEAKTREHDSAKNDLNDAYKKIKEYDTALAQKINENTNLTLQLNEYSAKLKTYHDQANGIESQFRSMNRDMEAEKEKHASIQKRQREEISQKSTELESLKAKLKAIEDNEKLLSASIVECRDKIDALTSQLQKENELNESLKALNAKANSDLVQKSKLADEMLNQIKTMKDFNNKFEDHYKLKKKVYEETEQMNKDLKLKIDQWERENGELQNKVIQTESRNRYVVEEANFLREKVKTLVYENQQLKAQKDDLVKKISDTPIVESGRESLVFNGIKPKSAVLSTPKLKSVDDSYIKFTSPDLRTHEIFGEMNNDDASRRYSIDSFSRNANNASMSMVPPAFNRFNTISENEFEEPSINQKFLQIENHSGAMHRLSTLQTRNQQAKPHLKSSYALENLPVSSDDQVTGQANKEKENRMSNVTSKTLLKRRHDDTVDLNTPKKSHTTVNTFKQTNI